MREQCSLLFSSDGSNSDGMVRRNGFLIFIAVCFKCLKDLLKVGSVLGLAKAFEWIDCSYICVNFFAQL